jgi:hypothetical protein
LYLLQLLICFLVIFLFENLSIIWVGGNNIQNQMMRVAYQRSYHDADWNYFEVKHICRWWLLSQSFHVFSLKKKSSCIAAFFLFGFFLTVFLWRSLTGGKTPHKQTIFTEQN